MSDVLLVDDDSDFVLSLIRALKSEGIEAKLHGASSREKALEIASSTNPKVAVIDLSLSEAQGVDSGFLLLGELLKLSPFLRIIVLTGHSSTLHGVKAISLGASNFLEKPPNIPHLKALIEDGAKQFMLRSELSSLKEKEALALKNTIIGESDCAKRLREEISFAASTPQPLLLTGETGTGKGHCARAIHALSARALHPFITYQPSFGGGDLIRSDLFGHVKGAFTGATDDRTGLFKRSNKGTLFLDEIDELPIETQVTLLGVLQDKKASALGSDIIYSSDFRLITASNADPAISLEKGKIRSDFFHRISHIRINVPPLRERLSDIDSLSAHALEALGEREGFSGFYLSKEAIESLKRYSWPGNIRELLSAVEGGAYRAHYGGRRKIESSDINLGQERSGGFNGSFHDKVENFKRGLISEALSRNGGNQVKTSKELGLDRSTMRRFLTRSEDISKG